MDDKLVRLSDVLSFQNEVELMICKSPITGEVFSASKDTDLVEYFDSIPAVDAVEVVRCRECVVQRDKRGACPILSGVITPDGFYCALGQRREDGDESERVDIP
jgi:hypothetical protein